MTRNLCVTIAREPMRRKGYVSCSVVNVHVQRLLNVARRSYTANLCVLVNMSATYSTRLETRTKESSMYASRRVFKPDGVVKAKLVET